MAGFWKFCAVVWAVGICAGLFGGGAEPCYIGPGGFGDRFSRGFSTQVAQNPQELVNAQGATEIAAAKSHAGLRIVAIILGVATGYYVGYSIHYALNAPACTGLEPHQVPKGPKP